jgi:hypothetical protein
MTNNNLADISVFEQLQTGQNARTGMSQMSVFNEFDGLKTAIKKWNQTKDVWDKKLLTVSKVNDRLKLLKSMKKGELKALEKGAPGMEKEQLKIEIKNTMQQIEKVQKELDVAQKDCDDAKRINAAISDEVQGEFFKEQQRIKSTISDKAAQEAALQKVFRIYSFREK